MSSELKKRNIPFSPPDMSELEVEEVADCLRSGWITTGPRTKRLEKELAAYIGVGVDTPNCVCLNSATASEELSLRILGIRPGDEVIVPAYTYTSSAAAAIHVGAKVIFVDSQEDSLEMDYDKVAEAINEKTKAIIPVDLGGVPCDYERIYEVVESKKSLFTPLQDDSNELATLSSKIQKSLGRVAVVADGAHALGASRIIGGERKMVGEIGDFTSFSFHTYIKKIEQTLAKDNVDEKILIDQLLITGNGNNRFMSFFFSHGRFDIKTAQVVNPAEYYRKETVEWLHNNYHYVEHSILTTEQRQKIKDNIVF